jgi:hypothetical protein
VAISRTAAVAIHSGIPWAASLAAETPAISGGEIVQAATTALNLGVLGLVFWLLIQGRLHTDSENDRLAAELDRAVAEKNKAEEQLSEALRFARDELAPLLGQFTNATGALLPVLQQLVYRAALEQPRSDHDNR